MMPDRFGVSLRFRPVLWVILPVVWPFGCDSKSPESASLGPPPQFRNVDGFGIGPQRSS